MLAQSLWPIVNSLPLLFRGHEYNGGVITGNWQVTTSKRLATLQNIFIFARDFIYLVFVFELTFNGSLIELNARLF